MKKWNLVFDLSLCSGCYNCVLAVKDEYVGNSFPGYAAEMPRHGGHWVDIRSRERGRFPSVDIAHLFQSCQHCDRPPCLGAASEGAVTKRDDGIVVIDPQRARGQQPIATACPFHAVHWNETLELPQHWNFDAHLIDAGWAAPRPVQACPTGALRALKLEDDQMQRLAAAEGLQRLPQGETLRTRVYYRNLSRYTHEFVAGTLVGAEAGLEACVAGAMVSLGSAGRALASTTTNPWGDFRFDALPKGSYRLEVLAQGYQAHARDFDLTDSLWLGEIRLQAA